jgi:hypothetical protein
MDARVTNILRWLVGLSLVFGGLALAGGAVTMQTSAPGSAWVVGLVVVAALEMVVVAYLERERTWPWYLPAVFPVMFLMAGVIWARYDDLGHIFLSGFAPIVAFLTGLGILARKPWSWPLAFASVAGFGPTILLFAPLPTAAIAGAFILFLIDAAFLLALAPKYFEPQPLRS